MISATELTFAVGECAVVAYEIGGALMAAGGIAAAVDAVAVGMLNGVVRPRRVFLGGFRGGRILNTNATVARTMLGHFGGYIESTFAANSIGEGFGPGDYVQDLIPFWNIYRTYPRMKRRCL